MLVDTHCHLTFPELTSQIEAVIARARTAGVDRLITVTMTPAEGYVGLKLADRFEGVFVSAGIHPHESARCTSADLEALAALHRDPQIAQSGRLVAVGETGLDLYHQFAPRERQEEVFRFQLELASQVRRPVVIHARQAEQRVLEILNDYPRLEGRVVFHCYSADAALARSIVDRGFSVSLTGVVTFANARRLHDAARYVPAERLMIETDAPFLTPEPLRGRRPNEPAMLIHTARFLAELRAERFEDFAATTTTNAIRFFGLSEE